MPGVRMPNRVRPSGMQIRSRALISPAAIVGTSSAAAFGATYRMERACAMQLAFQQSGAESTPIDDGVVSAAYNNARLRVPGGGRNDPAKFEWSALLRKLDRIDPSYKRIEFRMMTFRSRRSSRRGNSDWKQEQAPGDQQHTEQRRCEAETMAWTARRAIVTVIPSATSLRLSAVANERATDWR